MKSWLLLDKTDKSPPNLVITGQQRPLNRDNHERAELREPGQKRAKLARRASPA